MKLDELISKGYEVESRNLVDGILSGEEYEKWIRLSIRFLEQHYPHDDSTKDFVSVGKVANNNYPSYFQTMIGILEAFRDISAKESVNDIEWIIQKICTNFNKLAKTLLNRRKDSGKPRETTRNHKNK